MILTPSFSQLGIFLLEHAILLLIARLIRPVIWKHLGNLWVELLWALLLLRMLSSPLVSVPFGFLPLLRSLPSMILSSQASRALTQMPSLPIANGYSDPVIAINRSTVDYAFWLYLYLIVTLMLLLFTLFSYRHAIRRITRECQLINDPEILAVFDQARISLGLRKEIKVYLAPAEAPLLAGIIRQKILLPSYLIAEFPLHGKAVAFHELAHVRRGDNVKLLILILSRCVLWFDPAIHILGRFWRSDLEEGCDQTVISSQGEDFISPYLASLLEVARQAGRRNLSPLFSPINSMSKLKKRICRLYISSPSSSHKKIFGAVLIPFALFLICGSLSTDAHLVMAERLGKQEGMTGAYWYSKDQQLSISSMNAQSSQYPLASVVKVPLALALVELGTVDPDNSELKWNGSPQAYESWEQDQNLSTAMQFSVNWYFAQLSQKTEFRRIRNAVSQYYGLPLASDISSSEILLSRVASSPVEQVRFFKGLYYKQLKCSDESQELIRELISIGRFGEYDVYGKTGTAQESNGGISGWFCGFAENSEDVIVFAFHCSNQKGASVKRWVLDELTRGSFK